MKKIAFIVQRYGEEIGGGSEEYTKILAEKMTSLFEVHVITTCALEYTSWENHYEAGVSNLNKVTIHRFQNDFPRNIDFDKISLNILGNSNHSEKEALEWIDAQGPYSSSLIDYLRANIDTYDVFIPMTYLYWPTFKSIDIIGHKCIFIPTAHDEPPIYLKPYRNNFKKVKAIGYLTPEEKVFLEETFFLEDKLSDVIGSGISVVSPPETIKLSNINQKLERKKFLLYLGRIDESKGCKTLIDHFFKYIKYSGSDILLVLAGKAVMEIPNHPQILALGFVSDEEKSLLLKEALALTMSSLYESLSLVTLESMYFKTPIIANGYSKVLKGHCIRSNAGLYYTNAAEFIKIVELFESNPDDLIYKMGENGFRYVEENYTWDKVISRITSLMDIM